MPSQKKAKTLAEILWADKRIKRKKTKKGLAEQIKKSFSEKQAGKLLGLAGKGVSIARSYDAYRRLAGYPDAFDLAVKKSRLLIGGNIISPHVLVRSIQRITEQPSAGFLDDIVELEVKALENLRNTLTGNREKLIKKLKAAGFPPLQEVGNKDEEKMQVSASILLANMEGTFAKAAVMGAAESAISLGKAFCSRANDGVMPYMGAKEDPLSRYIMRAVDSVEMLRSSGKKFDEDYVWSWFDRMLDSFPDGNLLQIATKAYMISRAAADEGPERFIWWTKEVERGAGMGPEHAFGWACHTGRAAGEDKKAEERIKVSVSHLGQFADLSLKVIENYKATTPSGKGVEQKALKILSPILSRAANLGAADKVLDLGQIFYSKVNAASLKRTEPGKEPVIRYLRGVVDAIEFAQSTSNPKAAEDYFFGLFKQVLRSKLRDYALEIAIEAPKVLKAVGGRGWHKAFAQWYELMRQVAQTQDTPQKIVHSIKSTTLPFVKLDKGVRSLAARLLASIREEDIRGAEENLLKSFEKFQHTATPEELKGVWDLACEMPEYSAPNLSDSTRRSDNFSAMLECYAALPPDQRMFGLEKAREFLQKSAPLFDRVTISRNMLIECRKALSSFFEKVPELYGLGPNGSSKWIDHVIGTAVNDADKYLSEQLGIQPSGVKTIRSLSRIIESDVPSEIEALQKEGVCLDDVRHVMLEYARALSRKPLGLQEFSAGYAIMPVTDGETLFLPTMVAFFEDNEANFKFYKVLTSYQCGMIEFGTFECNPCRVAELLPEIKFGKTKTIEDLLKSFPQPEFAAQLFYIAETARIGEKLRETYPGLVRYMDAANPIFIKQRPPIASKKNLPVVLLEAVYQYAIAKKTAFSIPSRAKKNYNRLAAEIDKLRDSSASVEDSLAAAYRMCKMFPRMKSDAPKELALAKKQISNLKKTPVRGGGEPADAPMLPEKEEPVKGNKYRYDEWDFREGALRKGYVIVTEAELPLQQRRFVERFYAENRGTAERVRERFQLLKPQEIEVVRGQLSGDIDYDAVVRAMADIKAGVTPSDKVYTRTFKNRRSVAAGLLVDLSGSSGDFIDGTDLRPLDLIRAAALYYSIGLDALNDPFGIFAYSGKGRGNVLFYKVKDFRESFGPEIETRIDSLRPQANNRDGAGIRHATELLMRQPYKTKIMFYVTDFNPMDVTPHEDEYQGEYALQDTRQALREARLKGIYPCVLVMGNSLEDPKFDPEIMKGIRHVRIQDQTRLPLTVPQVYLRLTR